MPSMETLLRVYARYRKHQNKNGKSRTARVRARKQLESHKTASRLFTRWTAEEREKVMDLTRSAIHVAKELNRTFHAVSTMRRRMAGTKGD